jgi:hypothetical protein
MRKRNGQRPNAPKHGAFSKVAILPGEDPREFEELHSGLIEEWAPTGPTEEDAVFSIAIGMWRKRRVQKFLQAKIRVWSADPDNPIYGDTNILKELPTIIEETPHRAEQALAQLSPHCADHLRQKCPRQDYDSNSTWARAIADEISSALLPKTERFCQLSSQILLDESAAIFSPDNFKHELAVDERVDAMIDRAIKRLIQTKAMKQMVDRSYFYGGDDQRKKIHGPNSNGSAKVVNHEAVRPDSGRTRDPAG